MDRQCDVCGATYTAKRATSRYCGTNCRTRASRKGASRPKVAAVPTLTTAPTESPIYEATLRRLDEAGQSDSPLGRKALNLAALIDNPPPMTHSSVAGWSKEHTAALAGALAEAPARTISLTDQLKARRDARRNA
jgi:hypothetical protein